MKTEVAPVSSNPVVETQVVQVPVYYQVPVFMYPYPVGTQTIAQAQNDPYAMQPAPFDATKLEGPKTANYYRGYDGRASNVKSLEELLNNNDSKTSASRNQGSGHMTVDEMINQYVSELGSRPSLSKSKTVPATVAPRAVEAPRAPVAIVPPQAPLVAAAPVVAPSVRASAKYENQEGEEIKQLEDGSSNPFDEMAFSMESRGSFSKAKSMAQFFDSRATELKEKRDLMPQELHNDDMYLMSGMRPVKPVHTIFDQGQ
jgi:hypothetical protein